LIYGSVNVSTHCWSRVQGKKIIPSCIALTAEHEVEILGFQNNIKYLKEDAGKTTTNPTEMLFHVRLREQSQSMTIAFPELRRE